jgi:hypothetical protein
MLTLSTTLAIQADNRGKKQHITQTVDLKITNFLLLHKKHIKFIDIITDY